MNIKNHADLAAHLGTRDNTEASISRAAYKGTSCGAWAHLEESIPVGTWTTDTWHFEIKERQGFGLELAQVRRTQDEDWLAPRAAPTEVIECLFGHRWVNAASLTIDLCILTDEGTIQFVKDNRWTPEEPYYTVEDIRTYSGGYSPGVSFGSIVEGVEMNTEVITVAYPCAREDIDKALQEIESQAREIWNQTHGCPQCYDGKETVNIYGWASASGDDLGARVVDPKCPECKGQGVVI